MKIKQIAEARIAFPDYIQWIEEQILNSPTDHIETLENVDLELALKQLTKQFGPPTETYEPGEWNSMGHYIIWSVNWSIIGKSYRGRPFTIELYTGAKEKGYKPLINFVGGSAPTINEARHISHSDWDQFKNEVRRQYRNLVKTLDRFDFKPYFEEMIQSFDFYYDMSLFYIDEEPDQYGEEDRNPAKIAQNWFEQYAMDPGVLSFELGTYERLSSQVPEQVFADVTLAIGGWIKRNAKHLTER